MSEPVVGMIENEVILEKKYILILTAEFVT